MAAQIETSSGAYQVACPTTGEECPARAHLVELYTGYSDPSAVDGFARQSDHAKLLVKLSENTMAATVKHCPGPEETCPIRDAMDASPARQTAVSGLRKLLGNRGN